MTKLQSTGVLGLVAFPVLPASGADNSGRAGLLPEDDAVRPAGAIALQALRTVAAASVVCCLAIGAAVAVAVAASATLVAVQSPSRSGPTR
jgi:hypothetical protein